MFRNINMPSKEHTYCCSKKAAPATNSQVTAVAASAASSASSASSAAIASAASSAAASSAAASSAAASSAATAAAIKAAEAAALVEEVNISKYMKLGTVDSVTIVPDQVEIAKLRVNNELILGGPVKFEDGKMMIDPLNKTIHALKGVSLNEGDSYTSTELTQESMLKISSSVATVDGVTVVSGEYTDTKAVGSYISNFVNNGDRRTSSSIGGTVTSTKDCNDVNITCNCKNMTMKKTYDGQVDFDTQCQGDVNKTLTTLGAITRTSDVGGTFTEKLTCGGVDLEKTNSGIANILKITKGDYIVESVCNNSFTQKNSVGGPYKKTLELSSGEVSSTYEMKEIEVIADGILQKLFVYVLRVPTAAPPLAT